MKKVMAGLLAVCMAAALVGCGEKNDNASGTTSPETTGATEATASPDATNGAGGDTMDNGSGNNDGGDMSEDIKDGVDDVGDGIKDAVDDIDDMADDVEKGVTGGN